MMNTVKPQITSLTYIDDNTVYVSSDRYFNDSSHKVKMFKDMGMNVVPVDIFGGFVPENKNLSNLKQNEKAIQERFALNKI